jgi:hypothetical protein
MMTLLGMLGAGLATLALFMLCDAVVFAWRLARDPGRMRFAVALRSQGFALATPRGGAALRAAALRRCAQCAKSRRCERVLAGKDPESLRAFCPNIAYFDSLRAG